MNEKERAVVEAAREAVEAYWETMLGRLMLGRLAHALRDLDAERCEDDTWSGTCPTCGGAR